VTSTTSTCPYCYGDIPSAALACRHCGRDVSLLRKLLTEIEELKSENETLKISLGNFEKTEDSSSQQLIPEQLTASQTEPTRKSWPLWTAGGFTVLLLGLMHWVLFFLYDTPVVVFRIVTFCIPIALGIWAGSHGRSFWLFELVQVLVIGIISVFSMLSITHLIDVVPLWPQNLRDWRETIEYSISISLALLTGLLARSAYERWKLRKSVDSKLFLLQRDEKGHLKLEKLTSDLQQFIAAVAPLASGAMAVYSALKSLLG
jgi:hypothetical protein